MIKFSKIFSIVVVTTLLVLIGIGLFGPDNTYLTHTRIIKSPVSIVWRHLSDVKNQPEWCKNIRKVYVKSNSRVGVGNTLFMYMTSYNSAVYHEEKITEFYEGKSITFSRTGKNSNPLLTNFKRSYDLKRLKDGTTEISGTISYRCTGLTTKIYNRFYMRFNLTNQLEEDLTNLAKLIEGV